MNVPLRPLGLLSLTKIGDYVRRIIEGPTCAGKKVATDAIGQRAVVGDRGAQHRGGAQSHQREHAFIIQGSLGDEASVVAFVEKAFRAEVDPQHLDARAVELNAVDRDPATHCDSSARGRPQSVLRISVEAALCGGHDSSPRINVIVDDLVIADVLDRAYGKAA